MRMRIDETRRHRQPVNVQRALGATVDTSGLDDLAVGDGNIAMVTRQPRAVVNPPALDQKIVHCALLISFASQLICGVDDFPIFPRGQTLVEVTVPVKSDMHILFAGHRSERKWLAVLWNNHATLELTKK